MCVFLKKEREKRLKLGEWRGGENLGGVGEREKHDQNIVYEKILFLLINKSKIKYIFKREGT